ncbi:hypothetical protein PAXRUDRAFT_825978 [Paxillus rubicundulus Ve08.2h10]|uniref:Secreted protein n=1 Tax=Paxillus rubicundulus Ve08.2h10 TaxID=930991 RepID=A0A0D0E004_9AGAM|nr:hypothetical protein PAXRUDRAFT_825978 [Paxillus rubicundulus Ve08.2h10]
MKALCFPLAPAIVTHPLELLCFLLPFRGLSPLLPLCRAVCQVLTLNISPVTNRTASCLFRCCVTSIDSFPVNLHQLRTIAILGIRSLVGAL